jgi:hypothetical protein
MPFNCASIADGESAGSRTSRALELSRRTWLITSLSPGAGEEMSKHAVVAGDVAGLLQRFAELKRKAAARTGREFPNEGPLLGHAPMTALDPQRAFNPPRRWRDRPCVLRTD